MTGVPVDVPRWLKPHVRGVVLYDDAPPCDAELGRLGVDGLKRMIAFPAIALVGGPGTTYWRTRVAPFACIAKRLATSPSTTSQTSITLTLVRKGERRVLLNHDAEALPPLGVMVQAGDVLELAVHDQAPRPGYWSNRAGPRWWRCFGAALITDHLALFAGEPRGHL